MVIKRNSSYVETSNFFQKLFKPFLITNKLNVMTNQQFQKCIEPA